MMFYFFGHDQGAKEIYKNYQFVKGWFAQRLFNNDFNFKLRFFQKQQMTSLKYSPQSQSNSQNNFSRFNDTLFTREMLKRLEKYDDNQQISLQESIPVLYELNIFQQLTSIPEAKKRLTQNSKPNNRLQLEARFVYNLWKMISREFITMSQFKQIIMLFITEEATDLALKLEEVFENQNELIVQLLAIWEGMLETGSQKSSFQQFRESSVLTEQGANINESRDTHHYYSKKSESKYNSYNRPASNMEKNRPASVKREKQNERQSISDQSKIYTDRYGNSNHNKTRRQNIEEVRDDIFNNNLYDLPVLTVQKERQLINRLYVVNKYDRYQELKKIQDEERIQKELEECTFRPNTEKQRRKRPDTANNFKFSRTQNKPIPGFEKAIERMKIGQQKTKQLKQKLQLRNTTIKYTKQQNSKAVMPPKFLSRQNKKEEKKVLFTIQFDIGRHKLTCKIHENESSQQLARNIQSIYSLKQQSYEQIKGIIDQEMVRYFQLNKDQHVEENGQLEEEDQQEEMEYQSRGKSSNFVFS